MRRTLTAALTIALLTGCASYADNDARNDAAEQETRLVEHALGETEVPAEPERIVTLWASTLSATLALDVTPVGYAFNAEPIDGVDVPSGYDLGQLEHVGHSQELDLERVAAAKPDLILVTDLHEGIYDQLSVIAPTVVFEWHGTSAWKQHLHDVANALGLPERAADVVTEYERRVVDVADAIGDPSAIRVSVVRFHTEELRLEVRNSFAGQIVADVGLARPETQDVDAEGSGFVPISLERLGDADGDALFVFTIADTDADAPNLLRQAHANPLWGNLDAVKADQVHPVDYMTWISSNYFAAHAVLDDLEAALA